MSQAFDPKFIDLVRVTSTTQGTGPLACGPASPGCSSFAEALQPGDSFYYSAQGVEKPQEREVGRGTLLANGSISRQPIRGSLTNFTAGSKTIALIASSEWFDRIQQAHTMSQRLGCADDLQALASATAAPGASRLLMQSGREGIFNFRGEDLAAKVSADPRQALFVAPATASTGAGGAWVRQFGEAIDPRWFGLQSLERVGNPAFNNEAWNALASANVAAWNAMLATLVALAPGGAADDAARWTRTLFKIRFSDGETYPFNAAIDHRGSVIVEGIGPLNAAGGTTLLWNNTSSGIRLQRGNTAGSSGTLAGGSGLASSEHATFRYLRLSGGYYGTHQGPEAERHALQLRARARIEHCYFENWAGDGISAAVAGDGGGGFSSGNTNSTFVEGCIFVNTRDGINAAGFDSNCWSMRSNSYRGVRRWGENVTTVLAFNSYDPEFEDCAITPNNDGTVNPVSVVTHSGRRFHVREGQAAWCSTNAPPTSATSNQGWAFLNDLGAGFGAPAWFNGILCRHGGALRYDAAAGAHYCWNPYTEGGTPPPHISNGGTIFGGQIQQTVPTGTGVWLRNMGGRLQVGFMETDRTAWLGGQTNILGPNRGASASLGETVLATRGDGHTMWFRRYDAAGNPIADDGYFFWNIQSGGFMSLPNFFQLRINGNDVARVMSEGIDLSPGKTIRVNGTQVVGAQRAGWTAATGTPYRGVFAATPAGLASAAYVQSEAQASRDRISALEARLIALEADVRSHGLIN